jgi:hypothetical protein
MSALRNSEVVFMYATDRAEDYEAYGATFVGWGGSDTADKVRFHHDLGIRCTGSMWCLTAGAQLLHTDAALREAVGRDIAGEPIVVPWLWDHVHEGTPSWFGCTNHPVFRKHNRDRVRIVMAGGADGLHVDDHLGVATAATWMGAGCFCDACMTAFRNWLGEHGDPEQLRDADVADLRDFDYRTIVRRYATDRETYHQVHGQIPLMALFKRFHLEAAAENVHELGVLAAEVAGHPVLLSANAALPEAAQKNIHHVVWPYLTHVIGELEQHARDGVDRLQEAVEIYLLASRLNTPMAATASGEDWAVVKVQNLYDLVRIWVATAYAHGQRFMVPHRQWCFTEELGTHWYNAPVAEFAPMYRFVRRQAAWLDDFVALTDTVQVENAENVRGTARRHPASGAVVLHALNWNYDRENRSLAPARQPRFMLPVEAVPASGVMRLLSYDKPDATVKVQYEDGTRPFIEIPELRVWTIAVPA